jgi:arsenate reductase-like glutaredoxin family protein
MFTFCRSLTFVPPFNLTSCFNFVSMFSNCSSLIKATLNNVKYDINYSSCKLSAAELTNIINALGRANAQNLSFSVSFNHGAVTPISRSATTTAGSKTITITNTASLEVGMQWTGTGSPSTTAIACTFTDAGDLVNLTAHGLENGDQVSFATITTTTGITNNTIYFIVNKTADTFQVAATSGGTAIALTSNGSGTLRYRSVIESIVTNTSVTVSRPATSSGTNTLAFRTLPTQIALLKGWSVTG